MVSKGRLTRQELGWLLTQEAQGAAGRLRQGVTLLKTNPPPADASGDVGIDATLDALDDAMRMLGTLHARPLQARGRRGRVDLAALLWEVAPDARVSLEPGSGTEVFGDEAELRRMVGLLAGHGAGAESEIHVKRDGDWVKVAVVLGPDSSATEASERAWLSRMAIRYGGRYELEGGMEVVSLPADGVSERKEREQLEKELDEARKQGEAYARELAAAFSKEGEAVSPSTFPPPTTGPDVAERFSALARFAGGVAAELRAMLSPVTRDLASVDGGDERIEGARRGLGHAQDFVSSLATLGELDVGEPAAPLDLAELVRAQVQRVAPRASRAGVTVVSDVEADGPEPRVLARTSFRACGVLVHQLLVQAIAASPRGAEVRVHVVDLPEGRGPRLVVDDAGPQLPAAARRDFVALEVEPGTYGRPTAIPLHVAAELAAWQGAELEIGDAPTGGLRVTLTFSR
jgi:signal transduction histidine kinase